MNNDSYEIRICTSCGLRYPLNTGNSFGVRCPHCLGETKVVLTRTIHEEEMTREAKTKKHGGTRAVLLDNIRSAWNVGSILRSADGFGFDHAYLCGITPTPDQEAVTKTSLGAEEYVTWSHHKDAVKLINGLKKEGWKIVALEEEARAVPVSAYSNSKKQTVLILGSEVTGVDPGLLEVCDEVINIPMHGRKRSFNVAIAFGIAAYAITAPRK